MTAALGYVGKQVEFDGEQITLPAAGDVPFRYQVDGDADSVVVSIVDDNGRAVDSLVGSTEAGMVELRWPGHAVDGSRLPPGNYRLDVEALDAEGNALPVTTRASGIVSAIERDGDAITLVVGGLSRPLASIRSVADLTFN